MFHALIRQHVGPLIERLAELETELEDLRRRAENHNRIGILTEVNPAGTCRVSHGDLLTPWVKWFNPSAGEVSETRIPSVGEQCVLINYGGGDGGAHAVALCGLTSDAFPPASTEPQLHRRTYPDGAESSYDHVAHKLHWKSDKTSVTATQELLELVIDQAKVLLTPKTALVTIGVVSVLLDDAGIHFTGPVIDHQGRVISKA
ncbi:hypothetical protein ALQ33_200190 [Pseudomonas syringae pv. philadelphi]|uniref:Gp5/Type VI secretion system Vgr protein OB-fold domain-containing protein n=1 Tax=Pseudomonas syringae pv. philadelphi TaxID=251706 RepID=A0A3M3YDX8_9PSED|nr:phage baseplate assembly protein V [Pseudomonas syringae group genomosp. 3]RMO79783.1 hypothetical protein ALQ33_200190 [Pseudomonas syringae pv. philadelphi]